MPASLWRPFGHEHVVGEVLAKSGVGQDLGDLLVAAGCSVLLDPDVKTHALTLSNV